MGLTKQQQDNKIEIKIKSKMVKADTHIRAGECGFCMARRSFFPITYSTHAVSFGQRQEETTIDFCNKECGYAWARQEQRLDLDKLLDYDGFFTKEDYLGALKIMKITKTGSEEFDRAEYIANTFTLWRLKQSWAKALLSRSETIAQLQARRIKIMEKYGELLTYAMSEDDFSPKLMGLITNGCSKYSKEDMGEISVWAK